MGVLSASVRAYIDKYNMLSPGDGVVVGVSGGADSVALLHILISVSEDMRAAEGRGLSIRAVHINHMIRGEEAEGDESFVRELCQRLGVDYVSYREDIPAKARQEHLSEEEAGRLFRYECFEREAERLDEQSERDTLTRIAVAHNRNDVAETLLFNIIRGSSLLGMAGIKPVRDRIIRPLLGTDRSEIEKYLEEIGQSYKMDSTNLTIDYSRNRIRNIIIPEMVKINDGAVRHLVDIANDALQLGDDISREVATVSQEEDGGPGVIIEIDILDRLSRLAQGELILSSMEKICGRRKDITRAHIEQVIQLAHMETGKRVDLPYGMEAIRYYDRIYIRSTTEETGMREELGHIELREIPIEELDGISKKEYTKMIDCDKIVTALCLRYAEPDDYIVVRGDGSRKRLSRLFTDIKIPREERDRVPVVADGSEIVWVVGRRLSERYKIDSTTKRVMEIKYI